MENQTTLIDELMRLMRSLRRHPAGNRHHVNRGEHLMSLIKQNEGIRNSELAELLDIRPSSLSEQIDRLASEGLVERRKDEADSRVIRIHLTEEGNKHVERAEAKNQEAALSLRECLTAEEEQTFIELCRKLSGYINENIDKTAPPFGCRAHCKGKPGHGPHSHMNHRENTPWNKSPHGRNHHCPHSWKWN